MAQQVFHLCAAAGMQPSRKEPFHPVWSQEGPSFPAEEGALTMTRGTLHLRGAAGRWALCGAADGRCGVEWQSCTLWLHPEDICLDLAVARAPQTLPRPPRAGFCRAAASLCLTADVLRPGLGLHLLEPEKRNAPALLENPSSGAQILPVWPS